MDKPGALRLLVKITASFIVFLVPIVFWQPFYDPFGPAQLMVIRVFIPFLFLLYFIQSYIDGRLVLKKSPALLPLTMYAAVSAASVIFAINRQISLKYVLELLLLVYGAYMIYTVSDKKDNTRLLVLIILSHMLMSFYGILQHFNTDPFSWSTNFAGRPMGTIGNPDFFAGQLLVSIFVTAAYLAFGKKYRIMAGIALAVNLLCLAYTKVLGAYLGFAAGAAAFAALLLLAKAGWLKANKKAAVIGLIVIVACSAAAAPFAFKKTGSFLKEKKRSLVHRLLMWEASLVMTSESPLFGKGFGNYRLYYPKYQAQLLNDPKNVSYDYVVTWMPHQNYLLIAAETGLAGLGLFMLAVIVFYMLCYDVFIRKKAFEPAAAGMFAAVTAVLGASFANTFYNVPATSLYFFLMLFMMRGYSGDTGAYTAGRNKTGVIAAICGVALLFFIIADGKTMMSNVMLKKALKAAKGGDHGLAIKYYDRIIALDPVELCPQTDVAQYYYAAESYRETGDLHKALEYYKKDLSINPYCPEVNNMLGALSGQLGDLAASVKYLEMSVYTAPHYEAAYTNLATAYMAKKDYANARRVLEKFIAENGANANFSAMLEAVGNAEKTK